MAVPYEEFQALVEERDGLLAEVARLRAERNLLREMFNSAERELAAERERCAEMRVALQDFIDRWPTERGMDGAIQRARKLLIEDALRHPAQEDVAAAIRRGET